MTQIFFSIEQIQIPMKSSFKHASAERKVSDSVWVEAKRGGVAGLGEGCPRSYVTGETTAGAIEWLNTLTSRLENLRSLTELKTFSAEIKNEIDLNPAAWAAMEIALLDLLAREKSISVEELLGIPPLDGKFQYTAVLSDEKGEKFSRILTTYMDMGFTDFKFKISEDFKADEEKFLLFKSLSETKGLQGKLRLRLDGNNVWAGRLEAALAYLRQVPVPLFAIEEALAPRDAEGLSQLSVALGCGIVLDESLCRADDVNLYKDLPGRWITNLRVSKVGGLLRSLELVEILRRENFGIIVGAQVGETSVLSRAALTVARASGPSLVAQEGAFGTLLLEKDTVSPVVMFGRGGLLNYPDTFGPGPLQGLGLEKTI